MSFYTKPSFASFSPKELGESMGPAETQYLTFDIYRGTYLHQEKEYRYCELKDNTDISSQIYTITDKGVTKNA